MSYFLQSGDAFTPAPSRESLLDGLPVGNYTVEQSQSGLYFQRSDGFKPLGRLYGELDSWASRILTTFQDRPANTGVLLSGEKGSGKSLLGRLVSKRAAEAHMPTILISNPWPGDQLGPLLLNLTQPALIFFDEFEKVYGNTVSQESVLSLLDGTAATRHLFLLTINDAYRLDAHLKNRPGRLYYSLEFKGLEAAFVREYCADVLEDKNEIDAVVRVSALFDAFNFDMLKALVEEMNRYGETPAQAVRMLNITPSENQEHYTVEARDPQGQVVTEPDTRWYGNPLFLDCWELSLPEGEDGVTRVGSRAEDWEREMLGDTEEPDLTLSAADLSTYAVDTRTYVFCRDGWTVTFKGQAHRTLPHWSAVV